MKIINNTKHKIVALFTRKIDEHPTTTIWLKSGAESLNFDNLTEIELRDKEKNER